MSNFYREGLSFEVGKPSRGIGALTPDAAQQLGPKAVELQKKEAAAVKLPQVKLANSYKPKGKIVKEAHYNPTTGKIQAEKPSEEEINTLAKKAAASGPKKRKPGRNNPNFIPSSREQAKTDMKNWASYFGGSKNEEKNSYLEPDMKKRRKNNERAIKDMENTQANRDMVDAVRKKFDEAVYDDLYNFIIESLIKGGFVQDYKSAEHVIENMSGAWLETMAEEWRPVSKSAIDKLGGVGNIKTGDMLNKARYTTSKGGDKPTSTTLRKRQEAQAKEAGLPPHRGQTGGMSREYSAASADAMLGNSSGPAATAMKSGDQKPAPDTSYYLKFMSKGMKKKS